MNSIKSKLPTIRKWSPEQRQELLGKYKLQAGAQTQGQFCRENNLGVSTLSLWLRRSRKSMVRPKKGRCGFIPVQIFPPQLDSATLELLLPEIGSLKLHGHFDPVQVASLVKALRQ